MTTQDLKRLKDGDSVYWDAEEQAGTVRRNPVRVEWPDGQITDGRDDWALEHVHQERMAAK